MVKTTLKVETTGKAIQLILQGIRFVSEHLDLLKNRATTSETSVNFAWYKQKMAPFPVIWLVLS